MSFSKTFKAADWQPINGGSVLRINQNEHNITDPVVHLFSSNAEGNLLTAQHIDSIVPGVHIEVIIMIDPFDGKVVIK